MIVLMGSALIYDGVAVQQVLDVNVHQPTPNKIPPPLFDC